MADFLTELPLFCLVLTVGAFQIGLWCQKKTGFALCNPILIGAALVIGVLLLTGIDPEEYQAGASGLSWLLTPATVCLAVPLYRQLKILKKNIPAIVAGVAAGTVVSLGSIFLLCLLFHLDRQITVSLLPKSITTAIGIGLSEELAGCVSITVTAIMITGLFGNIAGRGICRLCGIKHPVAKGIAIGTSAHVMGTAKAMEMGEIEGAMSSLSIAVAGCMTVVGAILFSTFI